MLVLTPDGGECLSTAKEANLYRAMVGYPEDSGREHRKRET